MSGILQSFVLPDKVCMEETLYYRTQTPDKVKTDKGIVEIEETGQLSSDTYLNLFDMGAWKQYTAVKEVKLCLEVRGSGSILLYRDNSRKQSCVESMNYESEKGKNQTVVFQIREEGQYYFFIRAKTQTSLYQAVYLTEESKKRECNLTLVVCTYQREKQVKRNIGKLLASDFYKEGSTLYGRLFIRVVDNASRLELPAHPCLVVYYNPNTGGAGGFARGIIETRNNAKQQRTTHVILMDDDVELQPETFYRIYALLSYVKEALRKEVIAGRMFRMDHRTIQYTASEVWNGGNIRHIGGNLDVRYKENLAGINEQRGEYSGWWLAVFPYEFTLEHLPLPFFLHCDDVEYGLRHGGRPMVLNGIQVWHETYEYRKSPVIAYYDVRNTLMVNELYGMNQEKELLWKEWKEKITKSHKNKNYRMEYMLIKGLWDFLKGEHWLYKINGEKYHRKLCTKKSSRWKNAVLWRMTAIRFYLQYGKTKEREKTRWNI